MDELNDDLIYLLFLAYDNAPHILVTNRQVHGSFTNVIIDECHYIIKEKQTTCEIEKYYNNYRDICYKNAHINTPYAFKIKILNNKKICDIAVNHGYNLRHIPEKFKDYVICLRAVSIYGFDLMYVPHKYINRTMCLTAVLNYGYALCFVPNIYRDHMICSAAISNDKDAIDFVPTHLALQ